jgi:hypothetical protein
MGTTSQCSECGVSLAPADTLLSDVGEPICGTCAQTTKPTAVGRGEYEAFAADLEPGGPGAGSNLGFLGESMSNRSVDGFVIRLAVKLVVALVIAGIIAFFAR